MQLNYIHANMSVPHLLKAYCTSLTEQEMAILAIEYSQVGVVNAHFVMMLSLPVQGPKKLQQPDELIGIPAA